MLFFYIRHGDPTYDPDCLTELGKKQAEALSKRLEVYGLDRIYSSTSQRAYETAEPTAKLLGKEVTKLEFCNEHYAWQDFTVKKGDYVTWLRNDKDMRKLLTSPEVKALGDKWYDHPELSQYKAGVERAYGEIDAFMESLGYEHIRGTGSYKVKKSNQERVALFAHGGYGHVFLSTLLDIPYPTVCLNFDILHTGMTVIDFREEGGYAIPEVLTFASDGHLYKEGVPVELWTGVKF